jgi:hypothetical protein
MLFSQTFGHAREPTGDLLQTLEGLGKETGRLRRCTGHCWPRVFFKPAAWQLFTAGAAAEEGLRRPSCPGNE